LNNFAKHAGYTWVIVHLLQLSGGIHRYLEAFADGGFFKGKNFVFDHRYFLLCFLPLLRFSALEVLLGLSSAFYQLFRVRITRYSAACITVDCVSYWFCDGKRRVAFQDLWINTCGYVSLSACGFLLMQTEGKQLMFL
jgi:hypothetical protein